METQISLPIAPQFVTNPPPPPEPEPLVTELPRGDIFFSEGYGEFEIGDTFIIDNPVTIPDTTRDPNEPQTEYVITGFEGFLTTDKDGYVTEHVQILHRDLHDTNAEEGCFKYTAFCDAVYRAKFVTITSPAYLIDEINAIIAPEPPPEPVDVVYNSVTGKTIDLTDSEITREFLNEIKAFQSYYYDM